MSMSRLSMDMGTDTITVTAAVSDMGTNGCTDIGTDVETNVNVDLNADVDVNMGTDTPGMGMDISTM